MCWIELTFLTRSSSPPKPTSTPTRRYICIKTALYWKLQCRTALLEMRRSSATELFPRSSFNSSQTISDAHGRHIKVWPGNHGMRSVVKRFDWGRGPWEQLLSDRSTIDPVYEPLSASIIKACVMLELQPREILYCTVLNHWIILNRANNKQ